MFKTSVCIAWILLLSQVVWSQTYADVQTMLVGMWRSSNSNVELAKSQIESPPEVIEFVFQITGEYMKYVKEHADGVIYFQETGQWRLSSDITGIEFFDVQVEPNTIKIIDDDGIAVHMPVEVSNHIIKIISISENELVLGEQWTDSQKSSRIYLRI
jgi:hypothetical protein